MDNALEPSEIFRSPLIYKEPVRNEKNDLATWQGGSEVDESPQRAHRPGGDRLALGN
jgi:hypothetical protein